jgi:hypothetical protein
MNSEFELQVKFMGYTDQGVIVDICGYPMLMPNIDIEKLNKKLVETGENPLRPIMVKRINHDGTKTEVEFAK